MSQDCKLELVDGEYVCSVCGFGKGRGFTVQFGRNCGELPDVNAPPVQQYPPEQEVCQSPTRQALEADCYALIKQDLGERTEADVATTLDKCFGGCDWLVEGWCDRFVNRCTRYTQWIKYLINSVCPRARND